MALIDFAILTALPEELKYLKSALPRGEEVTDSYTWYRTRVKSVNDTNYEIVLACQDKMGPLDALNLTKTVLDRWDPSHIILVGIAGSFHEKVKLGDVIVSQQVFYFDLGRKTEAGLEYRPEGYPCGLSLIRQVHAISVEHGETEAWQKAALNSALAKIPELEVKGVRRRDAAENALKSHKPSFHVGTVASGSLVITDPAKRDELLRLHGRLLGIEMEGAGLMHAAFLGKDSPSSAIVIKGISDTADSNKAQLDAIGFWRALAAENSARLALAIIQRGRLRANLTDQFELDLTKSPPYEVRTVIKSATVPGVGLPGFARLVVPKGPLTQLVIRATPTLGGEPVQILEVRVVYHAKGRRIEQELTGGDVVVFDLREPLDSQPIGLYMLTKQAPDKIDFEVNIGSSTKTGTYTI
jgi:nucleoside phosphorylase